MFNVCTCALFRHGRGRERFVVSHNVEINYTTEVKDKPSCCCRHCLCWSTATFLYGFCLAAMFLTSLEQLETHFALSSQTCKVFVSIINVVFFRTNIHTVKQTELSSNRTQAVHFVHFSVVTEIQKAVVKYTRI